MDKFVKRLQTRANRKGLSVTKQQVRDVYEVVVKDIGNPTDEEMNLVIQKLESQVQTEVNQPVEMSDLAIAQPQVSENLLTNESIAKALTPLEENTLDSSTEQTTLTKTETNLPTNNITQQQLLNQIEEKFQNYPLDIKKQLTDYAGQNTFKNLEEAQIFLEQLRSMEFRLMMQLLADHNQKRQNLAQLVSSELSKLENRDSNQRQAFFVGTQTFLETMQQTLLQRMNQSAI
ncbi:MAG TPA: hypothetical protein V6C95_15495 [Coleofasciculaceae cyanobacterium]